jgi:hypothetical protein
MFKGPLLKIKRLGTVMHTGHARLARSIKRRFMVKTCLSMKGDPI